MSDATITPIPVRNCDDIDLSTHLVIEASAGTGKTYTIEHIVARLLETGAVDSLDRVLVVTFTEKATGEIRSRIRTILQERVVKTEGAARKNLREALDSYDNASIFTIHGFCNGVLQQYSFENGENFSFSLVDDAPIHERALKDIMRSWHDDYGDSLDDLLRASQFPRVTKGQSGWMSSALALARRYSPRGGDRLIPGPDTDILPVMNETIAGCSALVSEIAALIGPCDRDRPDISTFAQRYRQLNVHKGKINGRVRDLIAPLLTLVAVSRERALGAADLVSFKKSVSDPAAGFAVLLESGKSQPLDHEKGLPELKAVAELADRLLQSIPQGLEHLLLSRTVARLLERSGVIKRERGRISYADMIGLVAAAAEDPRGPLCRALRGRYRYAIVDEFQDTDMLQWSLFKNLFLEEGASRLIVVGDPKQAIYGFRGADVHAYHLAKNELFSRGARFYSLENNWRSSEKLIERFNRLFGGQNWFTDPDIDHRDLRYPPERAAGSAISGGSLIVADLGQCSGAEARRHYCRFMTRELSVLLKGGLPPGQIAILMRTWKEAPLIEKFLTEAGIRFSYYKKEGLYSSRQALEIRCLLDAVADPADARAMKRALMTRFFDVSPAELEAFDSLMPDHPVPMLLERWRALARRNRWGELFHSFIADTGLALRLMEDDRGERDLADFRHILETLGIEACSAGRDIQFLIKTLDTLISGDLSADDSLNYHRPEREEPGVQIMTIHASKGLQFSAVFLAGGFTRLPSRGPAIYHDGGRRCFDLTGSEESKKRSGREQTWEDERLYYVALTRAAERLYLPRFRPPGGRVSVSVGPLGRWIADALDRAGAGNFESLDARGPAGEEEPYPARPPASEKGPDAALVRALLEVPGGNFLARRSSLESFTSIKAREARAAAVESPLAEEQGRREIDEPWEGRERDHLPHGELPGGAAMGTVFHELFEHIDYAEVMKARNSAALALHAPSRNLVRAALALHIPAPRENLDAMALLVLDIVWKTLHADISGEGLIPGLLEQRAHEMEFYLPLSGLAAPVRGFTAGRGYLKGFIDLVFRHRGRYYILDWKSNMLEEGYEGESLARSMKEAGYDLQYKIYAAALVRMLKGRMACFSYEKHFGGIYYLYVRGIDPAAPGKGVFYHRPDDEPEIARYEQEIVGKLQAPDGARTTW
jgi:exodeoxyribonuclease V beta subunit